MTGLSLFSGAGIGELVFKHIFPNYRTIGYVEWDKYCQQVIRQRIKDGWLDDAPIFGDIRQFNERYASLYAGKVDWLSGGFPCQPFSTAARGRSTAEDLWPAMFRVIRTIAPTYVFAENVQRRAIDRARLDLREAGYNDSCRPFAAADVGADHIRERWWLLAHTDNKGQYVSGFDAKAPILSSPKNDMSTLGWWSHYPGAARVAHGVASRVDRLKALGNGWVPQVVARILNVEEKQDG